MSRQNPVTMDEVAAAANVSKPTVSRALSGSELVSPATRDKVLKVAQELGYTVNRNAQKLRHKRSNTIAVSIDFLSHRQNHISDPFIFELLAGVSEALGEHNQDLLLTAPNHNNSNDFQQMLLSRGVDGFIFLGQGQREDMLIEFAKLKSPMVVWGAKRKKEPYCVVGSDNFGGGQMAADYLYQQGRRNILFVGNTDHTEIYWRFKGLEETLKQHEETSVSKLQLDSFSYESSYQSAVDYFDRVDAMPDGIFTYSDTAAMAIIMALKKMGLQVPTDVSLVGYNDQPSAGFFNPRITTIRQDPYAAGKLLVSKLMRIIEQKQVRSETIDTELVVRET
ncbi:LacI family DNA-binding transcriptional regulator [Pseudoteredinibacter isoporae]|uniref:LacI family DNA-binding transcriptional regulator n=1 Tax=Pseudoteredinibacter isoporae TaxID=570281 RepID=UPI0031073D5B